jgi:hypothetical protein
MILFADWHDDSDIEYEIEFDYQDGEPGVLYYADNSGHPGVAPSATIVNIIAKFRHTLVKLPFDNFSTQELEAMLEKCYEEATEREEE